ncbi:hypothetical protein PGN35_018185 [Nodosilinea sp. PGN35]|uniref:hypothetical protein n=1 Tax=Nodosilinea sp. PGN35 TaxID=3020489 RepID=UPI0023B27C12|nr:hypothetical protein [Nodosilinea sp. TSF1-S3]MDF0364742.1 hypothetical protein [Nodosilinea sp. TSF1-S3]
MNNTFRVLGRLVSVCLAALLMTTLLGVGGAAQALNLDETLTAAGQDYLSAVLKDYAKASQDSYSSSTKQAQKLVNSLAEQLEKAADPGAKESDRTALLTKVNQSKASLTDLATAFNDLATETETFDRQLQTSLEDLLKLVQGDVRTQLSQSEANFSEIASTLTALATDAGQIDAENLASRLTSVSDHITSLNTAFDVGGKALKATATLAK